LLYGISFSKYLANYYSASAHLENPLEPGG
jgi:hypothetical protein